MRAYWSIVGVTLAFMTVPAFGLTAAEKCEAGKLKLAGKYDFSRLKIAARAAQTGTTPDYSKCIARFSDKWGATETAGGGMCPSNGDEAVIGAFIAQHTDGLAAVLSGGPLPDCNGDLATCSSDLSACNTNFGTCTTDLYGCDTTLTFCTVGLTTCGNDLTICTSTLATVGAGTATTSHVVSGRTFSSNQGIGLTGSMPNNGAVSILPGTSSQAIPAGYHDGAGTVAGDADLVAGNIKSGVEIFGVVGTLHAGAVPKTGETTSYGPGSDGDIQVGAARSFTDNGDGTITDNTTGLMWEKKSDDGSIHDKDNIYSWGELSSPFAMNGTMVSAFLATLNAGGGFAGYADWRIPNVNELQSLANYQTFNPAVSSVFNVGCVSACAVTNCSCTLPDLYWSSTSTKLNQAGAFQVDFQVGNIYSDAKSHSYHLRAVRGGL